MRRDTYVCTYIRIYAKTRAERESRNKGRRKQVARRERTKEDGSQTRSQNDTTKEWELDNGMTHIWPTGHSRLGYWFSSLLNTVSISFRFTFSLSLSMIASFRRHGSFIEPECRSIRITASSYAPFDASINPFNSDFKTENYLFREILCIFHTIYRRV